MQRRLCRSVLTSPTKPNQSTLARPSRAASAASARPTLCACWATCARMQTTTGERGRTADISALGLCAHWAGGTSTDMSMPSQLSASLNRSRSIRSVATTGSPAGAPTCASSSLTRRSSRLVMWSRSRSKTQRRGETLPTATLCRKNTRRR